MYVVHSLSANKEEEEEKNVTSVPKLAIMTQRLPLDSKVIHF